MRLNAILMMNGSLFDANMKLHIMECICILFVDQYIKSSEHAY